ncbi:MAG TPA: hypothetical protein VI358_11485 [Pseudolabrys sp.]
MRKFLTTLAVLSALATPAFAQSFCTCDGTGNVLKLTNNPITYQNRAPAIPAIGQSGLDTFAMVPGPSSAFNSNSPAATGGGSLGYNEMLRIY